MICYNVADMMALNAALQALQLADKSAIFLDTPADNYILHIAAQPRCAALVIVTSRSLLSNYSQ